VQDNELLRTINQYENSECHKLFRSLFVSIIDNLRVKNDTAEMKDLRSNQAILREMHRLLKITSTSGTDYKQTDGGYAP